MNTPSSREADRIALAEAVAAFSGSIEQFEGFERIEPLPERKTVIDPKTKLVRKPGGKDQRRVMTPEKLANIRAAQRKSVEQRTSPNAPPSMAEMARRHGLHKSLVWRRVKQQGMTIEQAVTTPVNDRKRRAKS